MAHMVTTANTVVRVITPVFVKDGVLRVLELLLSMIKAALLLL